jgi:threonine/homoserine/homoserine lactone efflux protein
MASEVSRRICQVVAVIAGLGCIVVGLLNPHRTALTWVQVALSVLIVGYLSYLAIRSWRRARTPDD